MTTTRWSDCSPALLALAADVGHAGAPGPLAEIAGIDEPWRAMLVSLAHRTRAAASGERKGLTKAGNARVRRGMVQLAVALFTLSEGQCIGPVVSDTN